MREIVEETRIDEDWRRPVEVRRNLAAWSIDRLAARRAITREQHEVASWYRSLYERTGLRARVTTRWEAPVDCAGGTRHPTERQAAARREFARARRAIPVEMVGPFEAMILEDESLEVVGHRIGGYSGARAVTAALVVLRFGCDILRRRRYGA